MGKLLAWSLPCGEAVGAPCVSSRSASLGDVRGPVPMSPSVCTSPGTIPPKDNCNSSFFHPQGLQDVCCSQVILTPAGARAVISFTTTPGLPIAYCLPKPPGVLKPHRAAAGAEACRAAVGCLFPARREGFRLAKCSHARCHFLPLPPACLGTRAGCTSTTLHGTRSSLPNCSFIAEQPDQGSSTMGLAQGPPTTLPRGTGTRPRTAFGTRFSQATFCSRTSTHTHTKERKISDKNTNVFLPPALSEEVFYKSFWINRHNQIFVSSSRWRYCAGTDSCGLLHAVPINLPFAAWGLPRKSP